MYQIYYTIWIEIYSRYASAIIAGLYMIYRYALKSMMASYWNAEIIVKVKISVITHSKMYKYKYYVI